MDKYSDQEIREKVRERYGAIGKENQNCGCSGSSPSSCCGEKNNSQNPSEKMGYSKEELDAVPEGADLGLGCGNPQAIAELQAGEVVLDLGSGGGFDVFLAAKKVGELGRVIGVDMTPEMISRARLNAEKGGYTNVEFRLGEIENLPIPDNHIDVIISNCVINLSPQKQRVFDESYRVLKPGGRLAISDVVAIAKMPETVKGDIDLTCSCVSGAVSAEDQKSMLAKAGFVEITIEIKEESKAFIDDWDDEIAVGDYAASAIIQARKPIE